MGETAGWPKLPDLNTETFDRYYADAKERIRSGATEWMQRNFVAERGRILDLYKQGEHRGFVEQDYNDMLCEVYIIPTDSPDTGPQLMSVDRMDFEDAVRILEETLTN